MPDEKGETRRERNEKFGEETPDIDPPAVADHVWEWFFEISPRRKSGPETLGLDEIQAWVNLFGRVVRPEEVKMLCAMDTAYVNAIRKEQQLMHERSRETTKKPRK